MRKTIISLVLLASWAVMPAQAAEEPVTLKDTAPDRYVVVKGDTLWGISGKFLKDPWKWPQIWKMNKEEIKNPHWIYPGDVIVLDMIDGQPRLRLLKNDQTDRLRQGPLRLSPQTRITLFDEQPAASIPASVIDPFLAKPLIVEPDAFKKAPRVALGPDERVIVSSAERAYVTDLEANIGDKVQLYRGGKPLKDPDTGEVLGFEVEYIADAKVMDIADVSTLRITKMRQEVSVGDRVMPTVDLQYLNYVPHVPEKDVEGKVISTYGGVDDAGSLSTVAINLGSQDGLEPGHVLFSYKKPRKVRKESRYEADRYTPPVKSGNVFIYRVFNRVSYGLVLDSTMPVTLLDEVRKP
ncbi:LysM peptidoglycan-binding domain-containing protein [Parachitinimonas caeni]|uniref:LysM peptidoglycan-binding domain-containing protein n=1 Tax=Parachitinimonas caeni TaxID=3031301 RepID=A0ABT7DY37_9NEIS|nr:LysM peptidoglycan-binding domain-containing protein [Parachitinimonas caeni]MDK2124986.1 LysM peptidoglycan-binding domain-containing protein [Parachitinimonas caeni]